MSIRISQFYKTGYNNAPSQPVAEVRIDNDLAGDRVWVSIRTTGEGKNSLYVSGGPDEVEAIAMRLLQGVAKLRAEAELEQDRID